MRFRFNATRMELLRLRRRVELAKRGHKLLQDKLDGLVQKFLAIARETEHLSQDLESKLTEVFTRSILGAALLDPGTTFPPKYKVTLAANTRNIMGVRVPEYQLKLETKGLPYELAETSSDLDAALKDFQALLPQLIRYAQLYQSLQLIGREILEIRRRVNALEYILIPELEGAVRYIRLKLAEMERSGQVVLLLITRPASTSRLPAKTNKTTATEKSK